MLYVSLVLSTILLLVANYQARRTQRRTMGIVVVLVCGGCLAFGTLCIMFICPPIVLQLPLILGLMLWRGAAEGWWRFPILSLAATAAAYGIALVLALPGQRELAELRDQFPYESLEARVSAPARRVTEQLLPQAISGRLALLEDAVEESERQQFYHRAFELQRLHEQKVALFINSPGFGVARLRPQPSEHSITSGLRPSVPIPQPTSPLSLPAPDDSATAQPSVVDNDRLGRLHQGAIVDFVYPAGFGYVKDRRQVAGFASHRFSSVPGSKEKWEVQRLELVGLLLHDAPVVYVSNNLPRMDELRGGPTRPLDGFEAAGLERLHGGEDLIVGNTSGTVRMLGALRSARQCVRCHDGERCDLLGAFSYTLQRGDR
jgi:hypothetical protein